MYQGSDRLVRDQMLGRIEALEGACTGLSLFSLCERLEDLRLFARRHDFAAVEGLASLLESVVAYNGHRQVAQTYLTLMRDAAQGDSAAPQTARVYLAAAALRGCR
ncbi:hypothetical protein M2336_000315 [Sphingobium sp. B1D7B]|uniref:hypothetical protein n=1 Tax=Sphingobium TaxID=165695 RepID=UPI0015EC31C3|nr:MULTISPECIES: hypothetical protein [Sphingobium]MCW2349273.1 hypothetical protein [Sphingobium sp. B12D2B]MCW2363032.1 hypothetical protein [Sphingobium sp. B10D3B]MCW2367551.1 hypothetical protein [Sphingobium sp. B7D2B]MCW2368375.1 hypothetical protein [Sphingobium sp. B11D3D]MCW2382908.1 hypothetical protein [Sphingobium sp. B2D3B]